MKLYTTKIPTEYTSRKKYLRQCSPSCKGKGQNGRCDTNCNTMKCLYDNGECEGVDSFTPHTPYRNSVMFVNYLLDNKYK